MRMELFTGWIRSSRMRCLVSFTKKFTHWVKELDVLQRSPVISLKRYTIKRFLTASMRV